MEFVESANQFMKKYSTWFFGFIAVVSILQPLMPSLALVLPGNVYNYFLTAVALAGVFATQLKQAGLTPTAREEQEPEL